MGGFLRLVVMAARQYERLHPVEGRGEFILLNRTGGIDVLGANSRALTDKSAAPDAIRMSQRGQAFGGPLIAVVEVVALGQRQRGRADELLVESDDRTRRVA